MYITIRCDVQNSKDKDNYKKMFDLLNESNGYNKNFSAINYLEIRSGDELFGIYDTIEQSLNVFEKIVISAKSLNIRLYYGIGIGPIDYGVNQGYHRANGPSIWHATEALNQAKENGSTANYDEVVIASDCDDKIIKSMELLLRIATENIYKRTKDQQRAIDLVETNSTKSYAKLYQELIGKYGEETETQRINFSRFLTRAQYTRYKEIINSVINLYKVLEEKDDRR